MELKNSSEILSFRIVSADHYMSYPVSNVDLCYSDFRGCEIKSVPVIRIFGSTSSGQKLCANIHGVFPYLYVPCSEINPDTINQITYQIASSLDKAINISLGQTNSTTQHVFKVSLVKGIPYYGYHKSAHQFFKVYLYNPHFIKRVANLFQNSLILQKMLQPHDSHIPYMLKFFIDYNLYGMSWLHVAKQNVTFRTEDSRAKKRAVSEIEIDFNAINILNRHLINLDDSKKAANPGIESIWEDERTRRQILEIESSLEPPPTQPRTKVVETETDLYYKGILASKVVMTSDDTLNMTESMSLSNEESRSEVKKKFNLKAIIENADYPAEFTETSFTSSPARSQATQKLSQSLGLENVDLDRTIEEMEQQILNFTQNLSEEDEDVLEIMRLLDENENRNVENDSLLSQVVAPEQEVRKSQVPVPENSRTSPDPDSEDELFNDFNITMAELEVFSQFRQEEEKIPQLDGADDVPGKRYNLRRKVMVLENERDQDVKKCSIQLKRVKLDEELKKNYLEQYVDLKTDETCSPPDLVKKYDKEMGFSPLAGPSGMKFSTSAISPIPSNLKKRMTNQSPIPSGLARQFQSSPYQDLFASSPNPSSNSSSQHQNLNLSILENEDVQNKLKEFVFSIATEPSQEQEQEEQEDLDDTMIHSFYENTFIQDVDSLSEDSLDTSYVFEKSFIADGKSENPGSSEKKEASGSSSASLKILEKSEEILEISDDSGSFPKKHAIFPLNSQENSENPQQTSGIPKDFLKSPEKTPKIVGNSRNFREKLLKKEKSPDFLGNQKIKKDSEDLGVLSSPEILITPHLLPPDPESIEEDAKKYFNNPTPHYGNPNDVTEKKEVGHTTLQLFGNRLNDLKAFKSQVFTKNRLNEFQKEQLRENFGVEDDHFKSTQEVKKFLSSERMVVIQPYQDPPSQKEARNWLKACEIQKGKNEEIESPVKLKREKILMCLEQQEDEEVVNSSLNESFNSTIIDGKVVRYSDQEIPSSQEKISGSQTPPSSAFLSYSARRKNMKLKKSFKKRFNSILKGKILDEMRKTPTPTSQSSNPDTHSGSSNDSVLKLMEQSTFIRNANNLDETNFHNSCEISVATSDTSGAFKMKLENLQKTRSSTESSFLTTLSVEIHVQTRKELRPDPEVDPISAIFFVVENDVPADHETPNLVKGIITYHTQFQLKYMKSNVDIFLVNSELELFEVFLETVGKWDPDIFAGYEIEMASWGYIVQRGFALNLNLMNKLSRVPWEKEKAVKKEDEEELGERGDYNSEMKIPGRILLDVWRLLRHEIALTSYTFENTMYHILHRRYPKHSFSHLTSLWERSQMAWIVLDYYMDRAFGTIELLKQLDLVGRTCELAKLFGIQFYEVLSRGSQFRVESMMLRIAKPRNYVPVSPSVQQRAHMRSPEYIPLVLEPQSRFYSDPVIVLDFQSLYPSIIIAYNYCFSTCLGRVEHLGQSSQPFEFGAAQLRIPPKLLKNELLDKNLLTVSPCGVAFVKSEVREGVLPRMLREILDTRLMVKSSMKIHKNDSALQRVLHSRQLGLKLIANVTYGYTAANFSGRMPCIEVGDSVVSKGRETLERAIKMVEENEKWGCRVVYGDTDSLFVMVPGRTREEAFQIGEEIAKKVTNENPPPVKLKLEKVYQPCILQTKKRYVGFMYENADQKEPTYEAKGIETVRRDGCPAVAKILEKSLRILFESCDVSRVKDYVCRQFTKILTGRSNLMDLIFAKEFRGLNGYKEKACVPSLVMTRRWKLSDPRAEPRRGERVPFVIINGAPGLPLIKLVKTPLEVLRDENYKVNAIYYITKAIIPALNRCFLLIGADVNDWFAELPRKQQFIPMLLKNGEFNAGGKQKSTISQYFSSTSCATDCGRQCKIGAGVCDTCKKQPQKTVTILSEKSFRLERKAATVKKICESCCRRSFETDCISLDCPVLYSLQRVENESKQTEFYRQVLDKF